MGTTLRPMTMEAAAGKNPVSHVGKTYNLLSHQIAGEIYDSLDAVEEVYIWLCSQIGGRLDEPWSVAAQVALGDSASMADVEEPIKNIICSELTQIEAFTERLARGEFHVW